MHHSSTSTYKPNVIEIEETFCGWTDVRTFDTGFIRSDLITVLLSLALELSLRTHLKSLALKVESLSLALKVESLLALI